MFFNNDWDNALKDILESPSFNTLLDFVREEYIKDSDLTYPPKNKVFRCFKLTPYNNVKVVILGQDPYHEKGQANGLCFSVNDGVKLPPSLVNIYKELSTDLNSKVNMTGDLSSWAKQGVLLLNAVLTVKDGKACSHANVGWENFTDQVIKAINNKNESVVFILWGNYARKKASLITNPKHYIIQSAHPSPLSAFNGFFGSKPFSKCNSFLKKSNKEINWME